MRGGRKEEKDVGSENGHPHFLKCGRAPGWCLQSCNWTHPVDANRSHGWRWRFFTETLSCRRCAATLSMTCYFMRRQLMRRCRPRCRGGYQDFSPAWRLLCGLQVRDTRLPGSHHVPCNIIVISSTATAPPTQQCMTCWYYRTGRRLWRYGTLILATQWQGTTG